MAGEQNCTVLDSTLSISEVATLYDTLKCLVATDNDVTIDGSKVESIDTSAAQVLVSFVKSVEDRGCRVHWKSGSEALCLTAELLGMEDWIECELK